MGADSAEVRASPQRLGHIELVRPSTGQANSVMKNGDGSYQIKTNKEVLIKGLLLGPSGSHWDVGAALPYPTNTFVWIWTSKKAEGLKHQTITDKNGKPPFLVTSPADTLIEQTDIASQQIDQLVSHTQWVAKIPTAATTNSAGSVKLKYTVLSTSESNEGNKAEGRGWILNIALVQEQSKIIDHCRTHIQVYAELRRKRVWTKEPETGARPARKRTMSGSSTGSSEPSLSQLSQSSQTPDTTATPPTPFSRSNGVHRERRNQGRISDEEDDDDQDHNRDIVRFYRAFSLLPRDDQKRIMEFTDDITKMRQN